MRGLLALVVEGVVTLAMGEVGRIAERGGDPVKVNAELPYAGFALWALNQERVLKPAVRHPQSMAVALNYDVLGPGADEAAGLDRPGAVILPHFSVLLYGQKSTFGLEGFGGGIRIRSRC